MARLAASLALASSALAGPADLACQSLLRDLGRHSDLELAALCRRRLAPEVCRGLRPLAAGRPWSDEDVAGRCAAFGARGLEGVASLAPQPAMPALPDMPEMPAVPPLPAKLTDLPEVPLVPSTPPAIPANAADLSATALDQALANKTNVTLASVNQSLLVVLPPRNLTQPVLPPLVVYNASMTPLVVPPVVLPIPNMAQLVLPLPATPHMPLPVQPAPAAPMDASVRNKTNGTDLLAVPAPTLAAAAAIEAAPTTPEPTPAPTAAPATQAPTSTEAPTTTAEEEPTTTAEEEPTSTEAQAARANDTADAAAPAAVRLWDARLRSPGVRGGARAWALPAVLLASAGAVVAGAALVGRRARRAPLLSEEEGDLLE